jgi:hypothetical protein
MYVNLNKFKAQVQAALEEGTCLFGAMKSEAPVKANTPAKAVSFLSKAKNLLQSMPAASKTTKFGIGAIVVAALAYVGFTRSAAPQTSAPAKKNGESPSKWQQFQSNAKAAYQSASSSVSGLVNTYPRTAKVMGLAAGAGIVFLGSKLLKTSPAAAPAPAPQQPGRNDYWTPEAIAYREKEIYPTSVTNTEAPEDALESTSRWELPEEILEQNRDEEIYRKLEPIIGKDPSSNNEKTDSMLDQIIGFMTGPSKEEKLQRTLEQFRNELNPKIEREQLKRDQANLKGLVVPFGTKVELGNGVTHIVNNDVLP